MADANLTLKISADSSAAKAGTKDVIAGINSVGVAADATTKKIRATAVSARQIYEDEIRVTCSGRPA